MCSLGLLGCGGHLELEELPNFNLLQASIQRLFPESFQLNLFGVSGDILLTDALSAAAS